MDIINTGGEEYEADQCRNWNKDFGFHARKKKRKQLRPSCLESKEHIMVG